MHISKNIVPDYNYEVAFLTYTITLANQISVTISDSDLIKFIGLYCPEINIDNYIPVIERFKKCSRSYHVHNKIRYMYLPMIDKYYSGINLRDLDFSLDDDFDESGFNDMKLDNNLSLFFTLSDEISEYISTLDTTLINNDLKWKFYGNHATCSGEFYELKVDNNFIKELSQRIKDDFSSFSSYMFEAISKNETESYKYHVSFDMFINNFSTDIAELKSKNVDYPEFAIFLHKYKLPNQNV